MLLCGVDIDSDDLQLILVTTAEYDKISALAEQAGHRIAPAETLYCLNAMRNNLRRKIKWQKFR